VTTEKDHILIHQFNADRKSITTGAVVSVTTQQRLDAANTSTELFGGISSSTRVLIGSDILYTKSTLLDPRGNQRHSVEWGPIVGGPRKEEYVVDCAGTLTGNIDGREFIPINYHKIRELRFEDGKELPRLKVPTAVRDTWDDVAEDLGREIEFCLSSQPCPVSDGIHIE
jgi:hypothetical protein